MDKRMLLAGLTDDQILKARKCKSNEELLELAKAEGVELTDTQLNAINGGGLCNGLATCPYCNSYWFKKIGNKQLECMDCGEVWVDEALG